MNRSIQEICDRVAENRKIVKKASVGNMELVRSAAAALIASAGQDADLKKLKECKKILRSNQGWLSDFRGHSELIFISKMAVQSNPEQYLANASKVYKTIRGGKFFTSEMMALAAMSIADSGRVSEAEEIAHKTKDLLAEMRSRHPFLVDNDNTAFAALLALTDKSNEQILAEVEACYEIMKDEFPMHKSSVYALCQVLGIYEGTPEEKCARVMSLYKSFKKNHMRYGKDHELAFLGVLANINVDEKTILADVIEACNTIKRRRGFSFVYMDKQTRLVFGSMIAVCKYSSNANDTAAAVSNAISLAIVQEIVMMILLMTIYTTTATTTTSSN